MVPGALGSAYGAAVTRAKAAPAAPRNPYHQHACMYAVAFIPSIRFIAAQHSTAQHSNPNTRCFIPIDWMLLWKEQTNHRSQTLRTLQIEYCTWYWSKRLFIRQKQRASLQTYCNPQERAFLMMRQSHLPSNNHRKPHKTRKFGVSYHLTMLSYHTTMLKLCKTTI